MFSAAIMFSNVLLHDFQNLNNDLLHLIVCLTDYGYTGYCYQQTDARKDLRPISLTPLLSKGLESHVVKWLWEIIFDKIDPK